MFNYVSFCKYLRVYEINNNIRRFIIKNQQSKNLDNNVVIVSQEIFKFLMSQITSLRKLEFTDMSLKQHTTFISYPGARDCLKDLSELSCFSNVCPEFFIRYLRYVKIYKFFS